MNTLNRGHNRTEMQKQNANSKKHYIADLSRLADIGLNLIKQCYLGIEKKTKNFQGFAKEIRDENDRLGKSPERAQKLRRIRRVK